MQLLNSLGKIVDTEVVVMDVEVLCSLDGSEAIGPSKTKPSTRAISVGALSEFYNI